MKLVYLFASLMCVAVTACAPWSSVVPVQLGDSAAGDASRCRLAQARTSMIVLKNRKLDDVRLMDPDVLVVDFQYGDNPCGELDPGQVRAMKQRPGDDRGDRTVLAYLDIGHAENYRIVWMPDEEARENARPGTNKEDKTCVNSVMARVDRDVDDETPVPFNSPAWRETLAGGPGSYLSRIMDLGFDGVLLDGIATVRDESFNPRPEMAADMTALVRYIAKFAKERDGDFIVVVSDATAIDGGDGVRDVISGVMFKNRVMYEGYVRPESELKPLLEELNGFRSAGIPVMSVEYIIDAFQQTHYQNICTKMGYLCFITEPALNVPGLLVSAGNGATCVEK